jgi:hypothetical protein
VTQAVRSEVVFKPLRQRVMEPNERCMFRYDVVDAVSVDTAARVGYEQGGHIRSFIPLPDMELIPKEPKTLLIE